MEFLSFFNTNLAFFALGAYKLKFSGYAYGLVLDLFGNHNAQCWFSHDADHLYCKEMIYAFLQKFKSKVESLMLISCSLSRC